MRSCRTLPDAVVIGQDKWVGQKDLTGRPASRWPFARVRDRAAETGPQGEVSRRRHDLRAVIAYRVAAVVLLAVLAAVDLARGQLEHNESAVVSVFGLMICGLLLGTSYYLGRTRPAPGTGQQLNWWARALSVIPIIGLMTVPQFNGLYRLTRRRLYVRNIAICAGFTAFWSGTGTSSGGTVTVLQIVGIAVAVLMVLRLPAAGLQPVGRAAPPSDSYTRPKPQPVAEMPDEIPSARETIDVSPLLTCARLLYWYAGALKFGAIFLALGVLAPNDSLQFTWGKGIIAGVGVLAALASAILIQENRVRPTTALVLTLGLVSAICLVPMPFGVLTAEDAWTGIVGWVVWPLVFLFVYRLQRRASGLSDSEVQEASRVGHLPRQQSGPAIFRKPSPAIWIRGIIGMLCAIPLVIVGLVNTCFGILIISDWIQAALDRLYALARGPADTLLLDTRPGMRTTVALARSPEPGALRLLVRGDLFHWGKLGPRRVPFEEFLRIRLETYGKVRILTDVPSKPGTEPSGGEVSMVVMPVGVPLAPDVVNRVAALGLRVPLLLLVQPIGRRPLRRWTVLALQLRDRGIALPPMDDPVHTLGILHQLNGENFVYVTGKRDQWAYIAAIYEIFRETGSG